MPERKNQIAEKFGIITSVFTLFYFIISILEFILVLTAPGLQTYEACHALCHNDVNHFLKMSHCVCPNLIWSNKY